VSAFLESLFPRLATTGYRVTSPPTPNYNCIAWAADDVTEWWWPDAFGEYYWPDTVPRQESIAAFLEAYGTVRYEPCADGDQEDGYEKVVLYVNAQGQPTHAARQLPSGSWTSKLGRLEDIEHNQIDGVSGDLYGTAMFFLKRPRVSIL
jgi:hypothetical protein